MTINISKKPYENDNTIEVWDGLTQKLLPLDQKLEQLQFTNEQIDFLDQMFHKLVNLNIN